MIWQQSTRVVVATAQVRWQRVESFSFYFFVELIQKNLPAEFSSIKVKSQLSFSVSFCA
jgi:hypothetical protein